MSKEDQELMVRIGQLAGQINRHKSQQAGQTHIFQQAPHRHSFSRHAVCGPGAGQFAGHAYRHGGVRGAPHARRGGRPPLANHHHRTLDLNTAKRVADGAVGGGDASSRSQWVSRTDRHLQLINADVYEKESQNRSKAIEESRQRKLQHHRSMERARFNAYVRSQTASAVTSAAGGAHGSINTIVIDGLRFCIGNGGKKLVKCTDGGESAARPTPKTVSVAGVTFYRTKSGNLVTKRAVQNNRYVPYLGTSVRLTGVSRSGVVKKNELCRIFSATGSCPKGPMCRYQHDPAKVAICRDFLKEGRCGDGKSCDMSHELTPERVPSCVHHAKGNCAKADCPYTHSKAMPGAPVCEAFGFCGYCTKGADCSDRHVFECPDFSNKGICKTKGCKLPHRERASVLRAHGTAVRQEDVSSDDEAADSDDVDSDEVAEFVDAESDEGDSQDTSKDFLAV